MVTTNIDENPCQDNTRPDENKPDDKKAAEMGMFGKLTRKSVEWHPEKILCKRFNIPDPYPGSNVKGVPGRGKKKGSYLSDMPFATDMKETETMLENKEDERFPQMLKKKEKSQQNKIYIGPLSHLNKQLGTTTTNPVTTLAIKEEDKEEEEEEEEEEENVSIKPSVDIFKAIFENSDSSNSSSSEDEDSVKNTTKDSLGVSYSNNGEQRNNVPVISPQEGIGDSLVFRGEN